MIYGNIQLARRISVTPEVAGSGPVHSATSTNELRKLEKRAVAQKGSKELPVDETTIGSLPHNLRGRLESCRGYPPAVALQSSCRDCLTRPPI